MRDRARGGEAADANERMYVPSEFSQAAAAPVVSLSCIRAGPNGLNFDGRACDDERRDVHYRGDV